MYWLRRVLFLAPLVLVICFLAFVLVRLAPGGPFDREKAASSDQIKRAMEEKYHLDEPFVLQFGRFLFDLVRGDLGPSLKYRNHTVNDILAQGLPVSIALGTAAFALAMSAGLAWGTWLALRKGRWDGHAGACLAGLAYCVPGIVLGPVLIMLFAIKLRWFPPGLWGSAAHVVLPAATLGLYFAGRVARLMEEGMSRALQSEFVIAARSKGVHEAAIVCRHALPVAVLPVVSYSGPMLADLLTGSFVVENVFQIPGIGVFLVNSCLSRDYPMVVGMVLLYAVILLVLNLLVDAVYAWLDPRVNYA